jgi:hypothetical protein
MSPVEQLRADLTHLCPMLLPPEARAASLEIVRNQVTMRIYAEDEASIVSIDGRPVVADS